MRAIQFSPKLGKIESNLDFHRSEIISAVKDKVDLIIFPELSITGYKLKDIVFDVSLKTGDTIFSEFTALSKNIDIVIGCPFEELPGIIYNSALYFSEGKLIHKHNKVSLPNFGMFDEGMIFKAGSEFKSFQIRGFQVGILICREILFPVNAYLYYLQNTDFLIAVSNSPFRGLSEDPPGFTSLKLWESLGYVYAVFYHQNYVFVNRCGFEDGMGFGGGSFFAAPGKGIVQKAKYFEQDFFDFNITLDSVRSARLQGNYLRDEKPHLVLRELKRILNA